jgi:hypothetical protein
MESVMYTACPRNKYRKLKSGIAQNSENGLYKHGHESALVLSYSVILPQQ